jgi:dTDP-4-dehydrorhamnose reductase|tara:strand:+ start:11982 stop:12722 length:741 start_codon:yes stop_codon:yes gene_type:complete
MNIFLLGHNGYLGSYLVKHLEVDTILQNKKYDYFINCASRTSLEYCEKNPQESLESNYNILCETHSKIPDAKIISFSSYYVYDHSGVCTEESPTTDRYQYTKHKLAAEKFTVEQGGIVFRLGKLFGNPNHHQKRLTEVFVDSDEITLDEVMFNPTSVNQVFRVVDYELRSNTLHGVYNLSNKGSTSHAEYGKYIDKILNTSTAISIIPRMSRNFHNYGNFLMDSSKIRDHIALTSWQQDVEDYLTG